MQCLFVNSDERGRKSRVKYKKRDLRMLDSDRNEHGLIQQKVIFIKTSIPLNIFLFSTYVFAHNVRI
jgi:hypothetical protein